ncbi:MAG: hypothetical protein E6177_07495 [Clostridium sp.]|uniref:hypothetical protein n=1 Tax=Eisenbergiella porci TaxID=2652274 RepID=UPI00290629A4|nr:hypothetical protein [Clostridium sp.]
MGIFTGILCFLCFLLLLAKAASRKFGLKKADRLFMKLHKPLSAVLFLLCPAHIFFVLRTPRAIWLSQTVRLPRAARLSQTARLPGYLSGGCLFLCMLVLITLCHTCRDEKRKLKQHRILSALMLICALVHIGIGIFYAP